MSICDSAVCCIDDSYTLFANSNKSLKILNQNIRSINKNMAGFFTILHRSGLDWDIIVLTECWLNHAPNIPILNGYTHYMTNHNYTQNEGVVLYIRNHLSVVIEEPHFLDANCLTIKVNNNTLIICVYRPPSQNDLSNFFQSLNNTLTASSNFHNIILCGDINIDISTDNHDRHSAYYLDLLAYHGLLPAHIIPTHSNTCLDHFMIKSKLSAKILVADSTLTDHFTVLFRLALDCGNKNTFYALTRTNFVNLSLDLNKINFDIIYKQTDPNVAMTIFISLIQQSMEANTNTIHTSKRKRIIKPWVTPGLLRCMRNRDKLHKKCKLSPNNEVLRVTYSRYRNFCNFILRKVKQDYERTEIKNAESNKRKLWQVINKVTNRTKPKISAKELITPNNSVNDINFYFANVGKFLAEKNSGSYSSQEFQIINPNITSMVLLPTDMEEIESLILSLKRDCAVGWDNISSSILKDNINIFVPPLTFIFNLCIAEGVFPLALKKSVIHPIYKSGDKSCVNNYRPISVLPALSKIMERIMNKRLVNYLEQNHLLSSCQYGFRCSKSTTDAVNDFTNYVVDKLDAKHKVLAIFLDLSKAFDTVSIPLLLNKMEQLGIRDIQLKLFQDYLSNRSQCIKIDNTLSDDLPVSYGVPQGSIIGPTLFLIYLNGLCELPLQNGRIIAYADDTALLFHGKSWSDVYSHAQHGFNTVCTWLQYNILTLNADKSRYITFKIKNTKLAPSDELHTIVAHTCSLLSPCNCPTLQKTNQYKYLGVMIDSKLSFQPHIDLLASRVRKLIYVFKALRNITNLTLLNSIYISLCQSIITYCISAWGGACKYNLIKLERSQRAILKVCNSLPFRFPSHELYQRCHVLTVRQLFVQNTILKQHTILPFKSSLLEYRRKNIFPTKAVSTSYAQRFFNYLGPFLYNKINNKLSVYPLNRHECKKKITDYLQKLNYDDTEALLSIIS